MCLAIKTLTFICILLVLQVLTIYATNYEASEIGKEMPIPKMYKNGPGFCATNVIRCDEVNSIDVCAHLCLWIFEGYLMLNVSFTVWIVPTSQLVFELGAIENDNDAHTHPPYLRGPWLLT